MRMSEKNGRANVRTVTGQLPEGNSFTTSKCKAIGYYMPSRLSSKMGGLPSNMKIQSSQNQTFKGRAEQPKDTAINGRKRATCLALNFNNYSRSK